MMQERAGGKVEKPRRDLGDLIAQDPDRITRSGMPLNASGRAASSPRRRSRRGGTKLKSQPRRRHETGHGHAGLLFSPRAKDLGCRLPRPQTDDLGPPAGLGIFRKKMTGREQRGGRRPARCAPVVFAVIDAFFEFDFNLGLGPRRWTRSPISCPP